MQLPRKLLYTVSSNQQSLDVIYPAQQQHSSSSSSIVHRLFDRVNVDPHSIHSTTFTPRQAAAAVLDYQHIGQVHDGKQLLQALRAASPTLFIICWHAAATEDAALRWAAFRAGASMVTHCPHAVATALQQVAAQQQQQQQQQQQGRITCDWCGLPGLTAAEYWQHQPLYHIDHPNLQGVCQVCGKRTQNIARHLHDWHKPSGAGPEERTGVFALCIIRRPSGGKFLMTQEFAGAGFWVPGGGVDPGETLTGAAVRECWEEAGVHVKLKGILALESHHSGAWRRVIFWGEPLDLAPQQQQQQAAEQLVQEHQQGHRQQQLWPCCCPKTLPDFEGAGACWVDVRDLQQLPLRSAGEPCKWFPAMASGAAKELPSYDSLELPAEWQGVFQGFPVV